MKKFWPYILLLAAAVAGLGIYLSKTDKKVPVLSAGIDLIEHKDEEETPPPPPEEDTFKNYGPAPEFDPKSKWLNGDSQTIAGLKGKVVLVNFWTYSSINSLKTFPYLTKWMDAYRDQGLVIIGVHTPEFAFEKVQGNVENAIKSRHLNYPVVLDNDYKTWTAYHNQFWPAYYLIDRDGNIVYTHYGEGHYEPIEKAVRKVLGLDGEYVTPPAAEQNQAKTPELHLGLVKLTQFGGAEKVDRTEQIFAFPKKLAAGKFALEGNWQFNQEGVVHTNGYGRMKLNFDAAKVFIVAESAEPNTIRVYVDGKLVKGVVVKESSLYQLYDSLSGGAHTMEIEVPRGGFQAFMFTFS